MKNKETLFKAKVDLPGCTHGQIVKKTSDGYFYAESGKPCMYDCENEPKFFMEIQEPKFKVGINVILKKEHTAAICDSNGRKLHRQFTLPAFTEMRIEGELPTKIGNRVNVILSHNNNHYIVPESMVFVPEKYYFVSSEGIVHPAWTGRNIKADTFRKSVGNMHASKEGARVYVVELQKLIKSTVSV